MIVAEVHLTTESFSRGTVVHIVGFAALEAAMAEYERVADLMKKRRDKGNDLPALIESVGVNKVTLQLDQICAVGLIDFAKLNEEAKGFGDAYPFVKWQ